MIKKSIFEAELISGMNSRLKLITAEQDVNALPKAVDHINAAIEILDEQNMTDISDQLLKLLVTIIEKHQTNSEKFKSNDLLNADIIEDVDSKHNMLNNNTFEDESDIYS